MSETAVYPTFLSGVNYCAKASFTAKDLSHALADTCQAVGKDLPIFLRESESHGDHEVIEIRYMRGPKGDIVGLELVAE